MRTALDAPADIRESMRSLPAFLQPGLTWLTGKALPEQKRWRLTAAHHFAASVIPLIAGVAAGATIVYAGGWLLLVLPFSWLLTVHGMRKLVSVILHQCTHGTFASRRWCNNLTGHAIAVLLLAQEYVNYSREHVGDHHSARHMTPDDPTAAFIVVTMRCAPRDTTAAMWRAMCRIILSPGFHVRATVGRFTSHFHSTPRAYRLLASSLSLAEIALITILNAWPLAFVVWIIPLTIGFNAAAVLRLSCKHTFPARDEHLTGRAALAARTHGIFLGDPAPDPTLPPLHRYRCWLIWWSRLCFVHLPARMFVLVGDGPCHDYHHRFPRSEDWPNYLFARRDDLAAGTPRWPPYTEIWGLHAAIDAVWTSLTQADPAVYDTHHLSEPLPTAHMAPFSE
jgi:fatty acid desaturase